MSGMLLRHRTMLMAQPQEYTASGTVANFSTNLAVPLTKCEASLAPVQSGSGTPSPQNIRPISGWTGLTLYNSPTGHTSDADIYTISWQTEAGTVYGGTLDTVTGVLTVTHRGVTYTGEQSEVWGLPSGTSGIIAGIADGAVITSGTDTESVIANYIPSASRADVYSGGVSDGICLYNGNRVWLRMSGYTTIDAWTAYLAEHPLTVVYALATPLTYQLTPQTVLALLGTNNIFSDAGGNITAKYYKI